MKVLIRTDMDGVYGLGHAVRSLALAQALTARGAEVAFVSSTWLGLGEFVAPYPCGNAATMTHATDCLVVDTTDRLPETWYRQMAPRVVRIDHPHATPETCDLLVGPGAHWAPEVVTRLRQTFGDRFLYGWDYVMLAPEVTGAPVMPYATRRDEVIVFCAGGADHDNWMARMYQWMQRRGGDCLPDAATLFAIPWARRYQPAPAGAVPFTRDLLRGAALVVGTFGVTTYECLYYQTPMLVFARLDDDISRVRLLQQASGLRVIAAGGCTQANQPGFCALVALAHAVSRHTHYQDGVGLDGQGVTRLADAIMHL